MVSAQRPLMSTGRPERGGGQPEGGTPAEKGQPVADMDGKTMPKAAKELSRTRQCTLQSAKTKGLCDLS